MAFAIFIAVLALALYGYRGLFHDSQLYALQSLANLYPQLLGHDIYLRFGSQGDYTVFTPLYAQLIGVVGLEPAAAIVTFGSLFGFLYCAWLFAKTQSNSGLALVAVAFLIALPNDYGTSRIFHSIETFATPRIAAQALVLAALATLEIQRWRIASACILGATMMHPLIAAPGYLFAIVRLATPRQLVVGLVVGGIASLIAVATILGSSLNQSLRFDDFWFFYGANRVDYLLTANWSIADWSSIAITLLTLLLAAVELPQPNARKMAGAALVAAILGLTITWIGGDQLRLVLVVQAQPWRVLWLAGVIAVILIPQLAIRLWSAGASGRALLILLAATWLLRGEVYALQVGAITLLVFVLHKRAVLTDPKHQRLILIATWLALAFAVSWCAANGLLAYGKLVRATHAPLWVDRIRGLTIDGLIPSVFMLGVLLALLNKRKAIRLTTAVAISVFAVAVAPIALREWTFVQYNAELKAHFAKWRSIIPPATEVLWPTSPISSWILLERPVYVSPEQSATALFSREAAVELNNRSASVLAFLDSDLPPAPHTRIREVKTYNRPQPPSFASICSAAPIRFVITRQQLDADPLDTMPDTTPPPYAGMKLYKCPV